MQNSKAMGFIGSIGLCIVLFLPLYKTSVGIFGSNTYNAFELYTKESHYMLLEIIILGVIGILAVAFNKYKALLVVAIISGIDLLLNFFSFMKNYQELPDFQKQLYSFEYGWIVWLLSIIFLLISSIQGLNSFQNGTTENTEIKMYGNRDCPRCGKHIDTTYSGCPNCGFVDKTSDDVISRISDIDTKTIGSMNNLEESKVRVRCSKCQNVFYANAKNGIITDAYCTCTKCKKKVKSTSIEIVS